MNNCFIAINIVYREKLLNKSNTPIILYLSSNDELLDVLSTNTKFIDYIKQLCNSFDIYKNTKITAISVEFNDEDNKSISYNLQDIFSLELFIDITNNILKKIFNGLYVYVYKKDYEFDKLLSVNENLMNLYNKICNTYKDKINSNTAYHYFISEIKKEYELNSTNLEYISSLIKKILNIS